MRSIAKHVICNDEETNLAVNNRVHAHVVSNLSLTIALRHSQLLQPIRERLEKHAERLESLDEREIDALADVLVDAEAHTDESAAVQEALQEVEKTRTALSQLPTAELSAMAETTTPSPELKAAGV